MANPTVRGTPSVAGANATATASSLTPTITSGTLTNELMLLLVCWSGSTVTLTDPSGWTVVKKNAQTNDNLAVYYRYFVSGDTDPSLTFSVACTCIASVMTISGAMISGTPVNANVLGGAASTTVTYPAITPAQTDDLLIYLAATRPSSATVQGTLSALPAGGTGGTVTKVFDSMTNVSGVANSGVAMLTQALTAATAVSQETGTDTQTVSSDVEALSVSSGGLIGKSMMGALQAVNRGANW